MKIIIERDLIMFDESNDAHEPKKRIVDMAQKDFESFIERTYPDGITEQELNDWIVKYEAISDKYFNLLESQARRDVHCVKNKPAGLADYYDADAVIHNKYGGGF